MMTADDVIEKLDLQPHPEGGYYRQTWIEENDGASRASGTAIFFLLKNGESSHWHHVDAVEIWHYYAGAPLALSLSKSDAGPKRECILGPDLENGQLPQLIVEKHEWQAARTLGDWTLVGCTVSPGFRFEGFTLAPKGFDIP